MSEFSLPFDADLFEILSKSSIHTFFFMSNFTLNTARWSRGAVEYFGLPGEFLHPADELWTCRIHPDDVDSYCRDMEKMVACHSPYHNCEYRIRNAEGEYVWVNCRGYMTYTDEGAPNLFAGFVTSLGRRNKFDPITNLWTAFEFRTTLSSLLDHGSACGGLMLLDIIDFKSINSALGYAFGDSVLFAAGQSILNLLLRENRGHIYRADGPQFFLLLDGFSADDIRQLYHCIVRDLGTLTVQGKAVSLSVHASVTLYPQDGEFPDELQCNLFHAMDEIRHDPTGGQLLFFDMEHQRIRNRQHLMVDDLTACVKNNFHGFSVYFQPIMDARSGKCVCAETLLRWSSPEFGGMISPMEFIPILEQTQGILPVGRWVIRQALEQLRLWRKSGGPPSVSVNVSYVQFRDDQLLPYTLKYLDEWQIPHTALLLELTESCRIVDTVQLASVIHSFQDAGIRVALDDFGSGYASLSILERVHTDIVKLDHNMTRGVVDKSFDRTLVECITQFCANVGIEVCAEGAETEQMAQLLKGSAVSYLQGFLYDKPLPAGEFQKKYTHSDT